jgi:phosphatidylserine decarboxylase
LQPKWYKLKSRRKGGKKKDEVSGEVQIQFSLVDAANSAASPEDIYLKFRSTILAAETDDDSMSRMQSNDTNADDDTDADDDDAVDETGKETSDTEDQTKPELSEKKRKKKKLKMLRRKSRAIRAYEFTGKDSDVSGIIFLEIGKVTDLPPEKNSGYCITINCGHELNLC